jgi:urocanate hydratase
MFDAAGKVLEIRLDFPGGLPERAEFEPGIRRAPNRGQVLNERETILALKNALRYIPERFHREIAPEFLAEYRERGRIYGYRFRPRGRLTGRPIGEYAGKCLDGRAFQVMIDNNLDFEVALYPYELVTYGETGQVCQNWMQYLLIKKYLEVMTQDQTLVVQSGHPLGLFRSSPAAPRVVLTNGLMIGLFDTPEGFARAAALGVANYG